MAGRKRQLRELRIVLDTNALYTQIASDLLNNETAEMIKGNNNHPDMKISWFLPETVIEERAFQMKEKAASLLPSIEKVERLLGHRLAITQESLNHQVKLAIDHQLSELDINVAPLHVDMVDWRTVISAAHRREPPFQPGDKEKGFRDALILETFVQLVEKSPRTSSVCRIVLVTSDDLLTSAVQSRISGYSNAQTLSGLDELKNLINTLASQVDENFINELQKKADILFFENADNKDCLYYKEKIYDRITNGYSAHLESLPEGAELREADGINIVRPRFVKKEGQRITWVSRLRFKTKAYTYDQASESPTFSGLLGDAASAAQVAKGGLTLSALGDYYKKWGPKQKRLIKSGASIFEVAWSVTVDAKKKLSRPVIDDVAFTETIWE